MDKYLDLLKSVTYRTRGHHVETISSCLKWFDDVDQEMFPDIYGSGEVIESFENKIANDLGKEQAVFFPSGTMAQQIALRLWCEDKHLMRVAYHPLCHLEIHEQDGLKVLHHIETVLLGDADRLFNMEDLKKLGDVACVLFELPQREIGGQLPSWNDLVEMVAYCRLRGFHTQLDGARLFEVLPYYQKSVNEVCALFDSVYISFYKTFGGITGAMLLGEKSFINESKIWKRRHGGDLYHLYPYIISAEQSYTLRKDKMSVYWEYAKALAEILNAVDGVKTVPVVPVCNMFHIYFDYSLLEVEKAHIEVMLKHDLSLFGGPRISKDSRIMTEISLGDSYSDIPEQLLNDAVKTFSKQLNSIKREKS